MQQSQHLWHHLAMFFRDELLSWSWRRPLGMPLAPVVGGGNMNPVDFKQKITTNVDHVIDRINGIAPQYVCEEVSLMKICREYHISSIQIMSTAYMHAKETFCGFYVWGNKIPNSLLLQSNCIHDLNLFNCL